jgi:peptide/nickel transport system substrate-binding protein|nr:ABC transporter substrate-binding protein [Kofleriaceae bacterium]
MPSRVQLTIAIAAITATAAVACTPRDRRTPDDTLVVLVETAMTTDDPRFAITNYDSKLGRLVCAGLTAVDTPDLQPRLDLASRVTRVDDVTYDFTVRSDARFSDGSPVTGDDVAQTFESVLRDASTVAHKNLVERLRSVEAVDAHTARFHLVAPLATLMSDLDFGILSFHPGTDGVVGAGPYALRSLDREAAELDANPYYYGPAPKLPHVEIRVVPDAAARVLMLVGGSADLIQNGLRLDLVDEVAERPRVQVASGHSVILSYLMMNNDEPPLNDVRVRRAIAYALDRPAIIAASLQGRAVLATGLLAPGEALYNGDVPRYPHDVARANALLDAAGYPRGPGGVRMHLVYKTSSDAFRLTVARELASQLGEVGLDVEVRGYEFATFFADVKRGSYQLASMQTSEITGPDYYYAYFHSARIPSASDPDAGNRWRYRNADVDRLTDAGRHELDPVRQRAIYDDVQRIVARDVPIVPLWHEDNIVLTNAGVTGFVITPNARLGGLARTDKR